MSAWNSLIVFQLFITCEDTQAGHFMT